MGILGHLLGFGASALSGGLFGLIGNIATKTFTFLDQRQAFAEKQAAWAHETELLRLQMRAPLPETESESSIADNASWSGLASSLSAEAAIGNSYPWVSAVRALVRPALTCGLCVVLAAAFFALAPGDAERAYVADSLVFAAVTAIVWWFGDRAPRRPPAR
jgi:hypothetical protein